jgi:hypothetical protein
MLYYIIMPENNNVLMQIKGVNIYVNDKNYEHFHSLPKSQQEAIKQTMILGMLNNK